MPYPTSSPEPRRRSFLGTSSRLAAATVLECGGLAATSPLQGPTMRPAPPMGRGKAVPATPGLGVLAFTRLGFGLRPESLDEFQALGGSDEARLQAYVDQQLDPETVDDTDLENRLTNAGFTTLGKSLAQLWADHVLPDPPYEIRMQPLHEVESATLMRAVYSRRQLVEVLADFWHNHFNVYADWDTGPVWSYYDRDVIRAHVLGNFRQMLEANATSSPMLFYLDNFLNSVDGPNENYARELIELHTLGADSYFGVLPPEDVPLDGNGVPVGWVDADMQEAARCLTGWTLDVFPWDPDFGDSGVFVYHDPWHDHGTQQVLGQTIPANQGPMQDGLDLLDLLATHPATGRFIAGKLARRLISDDPPQQVVDDAAAVFSANVDAPDQLAQVVRSLIESQAFEATWAEKIKRPFETAMGALRATGADLSFRLDDGNTGTFFYLYSHSGQTLFGHRAPNGYPDLKEDWQGTNPRVMTWRVANWIVDARDDLDQLVFDAYAQTPVGVRSANALADFWIDRVLGAPMPAAERQEIVEFMAQGRHPDFDWPLDSDEAAQDRLRAMVGLIFMSPGFAWR